jgi:hypothetical protein
MRIDAANHRPTITPIIFEATIDRCISVTHAADQKADINCNASKEKGELFTPALVPQVTREAQASYSVETSLPV